MGVVERHVDEKNGDLQPRMILAGLDRSDRARKDPGAIGEPPLRERLVEREGNRSKLGHLRGQRRRLDRTDAQLREHPGHGSREARAGTRLGKTSERVRLPEIVEHAGDDGLRRQRSDRHRILRGEPRRGEHRGQASERGAMPTEGGPARAPLVRTRSATASALAPTTRTSSPGARAASHSSARSQPDAGMRGNDDSTRHGPILHARREGDSSTCRVEPNGVCHWHRTLASGGGKRRRPPDFGGPGTRLEVAWFDMKRKRCSLGSAASPSRSS